MSQLKIKNGNNWESIPAGGIGVPSSGSSGQFLKKSSSVDYATEWATLPTDPITLSASDVSFSDANGLTNPQFGKGWVSGIYFNLQFTVNINASTTTWISSVYVHQADIKVIVLGKEIVFGDGVNSSGNGFSIINVISNSVVRIRYYSKSSSSEGITIRISGALG